MKVFVPEYSSNYSHIGEIEELKNALVGEQEYNQVLNKVFFT